MASLFTSGRFYGPPLGTLKTYAAGTLTPLATYTTEGGGTANPTTINIPASGYAAVWLGDGLAYRMIVADANGVVLYDEDNITAPAAEDGGDPDGTLRDDLAETGGAALVGYGALTVASKLADISISATEYGVDPTGGSDSSAALTTALAAAAVLTAGGRAVVLDLPRGVIVLSSGFSIPTRVKLRGQGKRATIINSTVSGPSFTFDSTEHAGLSNCRIGLGSSASAAAIVVSTTTADAR
jgi:hypothetical protein